MTLIVMDTADDLTTIYHIQENKYYGVPHHKGSNMQKYFKSIFEGNELLEEVKLKECLQQDMSNGH
jgi:hypothetical protein